MIMKVNKFARVLFAETGGGKDGSTLFFSFWRPLAGFQTSVYQWVTDELPLLSVHYFICIS